MGVTASYMKPKVAELSEEYSKAIPALTIMGSGDQSSASAEEMKKAFRAQLLIVAGFKSEEIGGMALSEISDDEFQKILRGKFLGMIANNGSRQKVVSVGEVGEHISRGFEFVAALPNGEAVVKLPTF